MKKKYHKPYKLHWSPLYGGAKVDHGEGSWNKQYTYATAAGMVAISVYVWNGREHQETTEFLTIHEGRYYRMTMDYAETNERSLKLYASNYLKKVQNGEL
jgi:hypothetical protein